MLSYVFKKRNDMCVIDVKKTWEKLLLAARVIASIENPADVCVISSRNYGQVRNSFPISCLYESWYSIYLWIWYLK